MEFEKKLIMEEFNLLKDVQYFKPKIKSVSFVKNVEKSVSLRKDGNKLFVRKKHSSKIHEKIWKLYSKSIAAARNGSEELAAGYANRSALLVHLKKYEDSVEDIDRALKITLLDSLKVKLFCRKTECLVALQEGKQRSSLAKAKYWLNKIDNSDKNKKVLIEMVQKAEKVLEKDIADYKKKDKLHDIQCQNDAVYISYSEKYGRCLNATRDIKPGEFIFMEKCYVTSVNNKKLYAYCSHCLGISWTAIPCDNCSFYMFCGEKCKEEAWNKYHDVECSTHMVVDSYLDYYTQLSVRSFIMGIKEAGSIKKLKDMINDIEKCTDKRSKGFTKNGKFLSNSFRSLYSLTPSRSSLDMDSYTRSAFHALITLALRTNILGKHFNYIDDKNLMKNEDAVFTGTLLLRLILIFSLNAFNAINPTIECKKKQYNFIMCAYNRCCPKGLTFSPLASLINHSCDGNVAKFYKNDGTVVYFALKIIDKDSQLFTGYYCNYIQAHKAERQKMLKRIFEFDCECTPCKKDWHNASSGLFSEAQKMQTKDFMIGNMIMMKNEQLIKSIKLNKYRRHSEDVIREFTRDLEILLENITPPSFFLQTFILTLQIVIERSYSVKLHVPKECKKT